MARLPDCKAQADEPDTHPAEVGRSSAGQDGELAGLSEVEDMDSESGEELEDANQSWEATAMEGAEDAAPERPVHTHLEYGPQDDFPK